MARPASPPALETRGVVKRFRPGLLGSARTVLERLDLVLEPGASLGLVGPNGSGKSTLLRLFAGLERPSLGEVLVFGRSPEERGSRARLGYLPDGFPFPPELSPRAVLRLLGSLHGLDRRASARAAEAGLERVGLAREAGRPLRHFSLGMKRRFALAQACLHCPDVLLLDEPTAGLDAEGYVVLDELLGEARARGAALLLATHVLSDLEDHCERCAILVAGRIAALGATAELLGDRSKLLGLYRELAGAR